MNLKTYTSNRYIALFFVFTKVSLFCFGGGAAATPLIYKEAVTKRTWVDDETFTEIVALANALPGPSMTQMAASIGYRQAGIGGVVAAFLAITFPVSVIFVIFMLALKQNIEAAVLIRISYGIVPVVAALMLDLVVDFFRKSCKEIGYKQCIVTVLMSFIAMSLLAIHSAIVITVMIVGVLILTRRYHHHD